MKSRSTKVERLEESQTIALTTLARQMRQQGIDVLSLTAGEPDFPTPPHIKAAAIRAIDEDFTHYTATEGIPELLDAIVKKFEHDNNLHFNSTNILVSCGAKHSIFNALQAICNPGDEVVIASPYWVSYPAMVTIVDAKPIVVNTTIDENFKVTPRKLRQAINDRTKAFLFNTPSNPTGSVYSQGEIEELADVIAETGIYVISDEIYEKIIFDGAKHFSIGSIREIRDQVITINGVSKAYAMTGWRIGYLGAVREVAKNAVKIQSQMTSNATSIAQRAAAVALAAPSVDVEMMVAEFKRRRDFIVEKLSAIEGLKVDRPRGAFLLFPSVENFIGCRFKGKVMKDDMDICRFLIEEEHLVLVPGSAFGAANFIRLSYASSMRELETGIERMKRGFAKLRGSPRDAS